MSFKESDMKISLYPHQIDALNFANSRNGIILGDEQGLGKTLSIIAMALARKRGLKAKHCLIITCVNGLKYNWKEEIENNTYETACILGTRIKRDGTERIGGNKEKYEDLQHLPKDYFLIINIEALRYKLGEGRGRYVIAEKIEEYCRTGQIDMVAIDEIHKSNNPSSKQTRGLLKIKPNFRVAATGTLITNTPIDAFVPLVWLGKIDKNYMKFREKYAIMGGFQGREIIGYKNLDELNETVHSCMIRRRKCDTLNLPPKMRAIEYIEMNATEKKYYKQILDETVAELNKIVAEGKKINVDNVLSKFVYLRQVTGDANILFPSFHESSKMERCKELVDEYLSNGEKVIIFSQWTSVTSRVGEALKEYSPVFITGEVKASDRQKIVHEFQNNPDCRVIIGTAGAMGTGLTLTAASNVIFMDSPWTQALKEQCEDRAHRIGTTGTVNIVTLVAKNTIDEYIEKVLYSKKELSDIVVDREAFKMNYPLMVRWLIENAKI